MKTFAIRYYARPGARERRLLCKSLAGVYIAIADIYSLFPNADINIESFGDDRE